MDWGRMGLGRTGTESAKEETVKRFDKDRCVAEHEYSRYRCQLYTDARFPSVVTSTVEESPIKAASLPGLKVITLTELSPGKHHGGRVLFGQFCVQAYKDNYVCTVLEDAEGRGVGVIVYNAVSSTASKSEIELWFPLGMRVAIKEPFFQLCADGKTVVRVDKIEDICLDNRHQCDDVPSVSSDVEVLEGIRCEGNRLFGQQDWVEAVSKYSQCIKMAVRMTENDTEVKIDKDKLNHIVMLTYSNRAEARLRLKAYEDALSDADKALEFDPKHVKSLSRKGRAVHSLGLFEQACKIFKVALEQSPQEQVILKNLKASRAAFEQACFDKVSAFFEKGCTGDPPSCSDIVGPVEIRRVHYAGGGRGLFATERIKHSQKFLASNPLAIVRKKLEGKNTNIKSSIKSTWIFKRALVTLGRCQQEEIISQLVNRVKTSRRQMAQLYSLGAYGQVDMEVPSMELFNPGSDWIPPGTEHLQLNDVLMNGIVDFNLFVTYDECLLDVEGGMQKDADAPEDGGIWVLPSFANHSCAPNCMTACFGETMFFCASQDVEAGEELTVSYFEDLHVIVDARQELASKWHFSCKCERCVFETGLKPQLSKINKSFPSLVEEAEVEFCQKGRRTRATRKLAAVAGQVEAVIRSLDDKVEPRKRDWIRASYLKAYQAKHALAMEGDIFTSMRVFEVGMSAIKSVMSPGIDPFPGFSRLMECGEV